MKPLTQADIRNIAQTWVEVKPSLIHLTDQFYDQTDYKTAKRIYKVIRSNLGTYASNHNDCDNFSLGFVYFAQRLTSLRLGWFKRHTFAYSPAIVEFGGWNIPGATGPHASVAFFEAGKMMWISPQTGHIYKPSGKETIMFARG